MSSRCAVHFAFVLSEFWGRDKGYYNLETQQFANATTRIRKQASSQEPSSPDQVEPWPEPARPKVEMPV